MDMIYCEMDMIYCEMDMIYCEMDMIYCENVLYNICRRIRAHFLV